MNERFYHQFPDYFNHEDDRESFPMMEKQQFERAFRISATTRRKWCHAGQMPEIIRLSGMRPEDRYMLPLVVRALVTFYCLDRARLHR